MEIIALPVEMQRWCENARQRGNTIAFVPTMGSLHEGHLALMREGRKRASLLASSLFVNPTQFGPNEDLEAYPRSFKRDCRMMETVPVDVLFAPQAADMYPPGFQSWVDVTEVTKRMCGAHRPGHFRGVATVVAKLFNIVKPHIALFGEKDYQQLRTIIRMVRDLNFDVEIVPIPTVRESHGLAISSRNSYLNAEELGRALSLRRALAAADRRFRAGVRDPSNLVQAATAVLEETPGVRVEYVEAVDAETLEPVAAIARPVVVAVAAFVGSTRLIDNLVLVP